jgi:hypothetical protein
VSRVTPDHDVLMAFDGATGQARVVTDLHGDGSQGWPIAGYALSADRTRIALSSLYGATQADVDTKLPYQHVFTLAPDGSDFKRLTPVFPNTGAGRSQFQIEVRYPSFSRTGAEVVYGYGEYWYEGTTLKGGSGIWSVGTAGGQVPALFAAPNPCSLVDPSVDPKTGKVAIIHSVCIPGAGERDGIYLHAEDGAGVPELLVGGAGAPDVVLEPVRWAADGSGFLFVGSSAATIGGSNVNVRGLYIFDLGTRKVTPVVVPQVANTSVVDGAAAPDLSAIVYCLREGDAQNLHLIDLSKTPATDAPITNDGKSCHPVW